MSQSMLQKPVRQKPMLQIALDQTHGDEAIKLADSVSQYVDIIEVGTILAFAEGMSVVRTLRSHHPQHLLVCDMKITDGGAILSRMALEAGADWVTVSAAAHIATITACRKVAEELGGEIQIELYGNWSMSDARQWASLGIKQVIYHRSRDAELAGVNWTEKDLQQMRQLSELGLELSITGGIVPEDIPLFSGLNVKTFIAGRALAGENGKATAQALREQIARHW